MENEVRKPEAVASMLVFLRDKVAEGQQQLLAVEQREDSVAEIVAARRWLRAAEEMYAMGLKELES